MGRGKGRVPKDRIPCFKEGGWSIIIILENIKATSKKGAIPPGTIPAALIIFAVAAGAGVAAAARMPLPFAIAEGAALVAVAVIAIAALRMQERGASPLAQVQSGDGELKSILGAIEDALIIYGTDFRITYFNHVAEKLFGITATEAVGHVLSPRDAEGEGGWKTLAQVVFPSLAPRVMPRSREGELPQVADVSLADPELELRVSTEPVTDADGRTRAFVKIVRDRTPQIAALRAKSDFITVASHQLRGPATDINWALQSLSQAQELSETEKMIAATAAAASQNLLTRIEDLLGIAKMEDGQVGYAFESTDLVQYVNGVLAGVLPAARKAGVKIYLDRPSEELPKVMIDPKQLSLALTNILENAIRYNVENGEVTVKVDRLQGKPYLVVSVRDTGIGIPKEDLGKLFTKFYRAGNAVKAQTEGSGLGLYIAKGVVAAHGGQIWAESELDRGTTVSFAIPTDPALVPRHEMGSADLV